MKSKMNQMYEEVIVHSILEEVAGEDRDVKQMLESLDNNKKRMAILSILDQNRGLFKQVHNIVKENKVSATKHIKQVVGMLREYVQVASVDKKNFGEVMTPISLVEDMLNTLPKEVWSNPDLKWLDPCCGVGTFECVVVERLMKGLVEFQPNEELRYKHIMENMIHVCELQTKNAFLYICAFDPQVGEDNAVNIYNGSFLDEGFGNHAKEVWGVEKFDIIVMNPPYNDGGSNKGSAHVLWDKFVIKTIELNLVDGGYLVAVHPDGWRSLGDGFKKVKNCLKSKQMLYLELHDRNDGVKTFGVQTAYDFYCIKNTISNNFTTKIKGQDEIIENLNITNMELIPNGIFNEFELLTAKNGEEKINLLRSCSYHTQKDYMSDEKTIENKYPVVYTTSKDGSIKLKWSNINTKGHFGIPKIIWSNGTSMPIIDLNGEYAITEFSYAIIDDVENLNNIQKAMLNPRFLKLMSLSQGVKHRYNHTVIATFRKDFWREFLD